MSLDEQLKTKIFNQKLRTIPVPMIFNDPELKRCAWLVCLIDRRV